MKKIIIKRSEIIYPNDFYQMSREALVLNNEEIESMVNEAFQRVANGDEFYITETGDTAVIALNFEDEIIIHVSKNYEEFSIDKNDIIRE